MELSHHNGATQMALLCREKQVKESFPLTQNVFCRVEASKEINSLIST